MKPKVRTLLFGDSHGCNALVETLNNMEVFSNHHCMYHHVDDLEDLDVALVEWQPTLLIVLANGAAGMESVYRSRQRRPSLPIFWFSDDKAFSMQSYRLDCAYFSTKPVTAEKISHAIRRCHHIGISYTAN